MKIITQNIGNYNYKIKLYKTNITAINLTFLDDDNKPIKTNIYNLTNSQNYKYFNCKAISKKAIISSTPERIIYFDEIMDNDNNNINNNNNENNLNFIFVQKNDFTIDVKIPYSYDEPVFKILNSSGEELFIEKTSNIYSYNGYELYNNIICKNYTVNTSGLAFRYEITEEYEEGSYTSIHFRTVGDYYIIQCEVGSNPFSNNIIKNYNKDDYYNTIYEYRST